MSSFNSISFPNNHLLLLSNLYSGLYQLFSFNPIEYNHNFIFNNANYNGTTNESKFFHNSTNQQLVFELYNNNIQ